MRPTYLNLLFHIVFATKNRQRLIRDEWIGQLHAYMAGILKGLDTVPHAIGGIEDHVHVLAGFKATHCVSDVVRELKKASTGWVRDETQCCDFSWQTGYAAFTVSATARERVVNYIQHQAEHHTRRNGFDQELITLLSRAGISAED